MTNTKLSLTVFTKWLNERMKLIFKGYLMVLLKVVFTLVRCHRIKSSKVTGLCYALPWLLGLFKLPLEQKVLHHV